MAATVKRQPGAVADRIAIIAKLETALKSAKNVSVRFSHICVFLLVTLGFNSPATIINRRATEFAEPLNLLICQNLKKKRTDSEQ